MTTTATQPTLSTEDKIRRLQALHNRYTNYELAIVRGDERYRVCYVGGKSRSYVWKAITSNGRAQLIVDFAGHPEIHFAKRAIDGGTIGEWRIVWTGRTERQAIQEGELPHFTDAVCPVSFPEPKPAPVASRFALMAGVAALSVAARLF